MMTETAVQIAGRYPKEVTLSDDSQIQLRLMGAGDVDAVLAFARALPRGVKAIYSVRFFLERPAVVGVRS